MSGESGTATPKGFCDTAIKELFESETPPIVPTLSNLSETREAYSCEPTALAAGLEELRYPHKAHG